jgi:hypothetical protein
MPTLDSFWDDPNTTGYIGDITFAGNMVENPFVIVKNNKRKQTGQQRIEDLSYNNTLARTKSYWPIYENYGDHVVPIVEDKRLNQWILYQRLRAKVSSLMTWREEKLWLLSQRTYLLPLLEAKPSIIYFLPLLLCEGKPHRMLIGGPGVALIFLCL